MNGTIICTVDGSDGVVAAIDVARRLAGRFDARLLLVSLAGASGDTVGKESASAHDNHSAARPSATLDGAREEHRVAAGDPAEAVAAIAAEEAADLIIVGARPARLSRTLRSALARDLAATASCPVLLAPPEAVDPYRGHRGHHRAVERRTNAGLE
jgi:nucleotide-binding universal stress UspA family protein